MTISLQWDIHRFSRDFHREVEFIGLVTREKDPPFAGNGR